MEKEQATYFIGLMSGTSVDGIDAALVRFSGDSAELIETFDSEFPADIKDSIGALCSPGYNEIDRLGSLDVSLGKLFAQAAINLCKKAKIWPEDIAAIGSHGQTLRHRPNFSTPFTLQIGDPSTIAAHTGIPTVADFRRKDMALGGQGAPLAPAFHEGVFSSPKEARAIINIGGISNISWLIPDQPTLGFDAGPGNTLMDYWVAKHKSAPYDQDGDWARSGNVDEALLDTLLKHPFFSIQGPKSTGREEFSPEWLESLLTPFSKVKAENVQATLCDLTALTICRALQALPNWENQTEVFLCGGGAHNRFLQKRLTHYLPDTSFKTTDDLGIHPDWVEAAAFAWLAKQTLEKLSGNVISVTGAKRESVLGGVYWP